MTRPYTWDIDQSGATDGQGMVWDATLGAWAPGTVSGGAGGSLDDLTDVDTTSSPPADGDRLAFDSGSGLWVPVAPVNAIPQTADITAIVKITQAAYDLLSPPSSTTLYVIVG